MGGWGIDLKVLLIFFISVFCINCFASEYQLKEFDGPFGHKLKYLFAEGSAHRDRLFMFVQGDGDNCYPYDLENSKRMAEKLVGLGNWVFPETSASRFCQTSRFAEIDFFHRVEEITNLAQAIRSDFPQSFKIYIVAHSAGPQLVLKAYKRIKGVVGLSFHSSGHLPLDAMLVNQVLNQGYKEYWPESDIHGKISDLSRDLNQIKTRCDSQERVWPRSNKYYCQMFEPSFDQDILNIPDHLKVIIFHGYNDKTVAVEEAFNVYSRLLKHKKNATLKIIGNMDHSFSRNIPKFIDALREWVERK